MDFGAIVGGLSVFFDGLGIVNTAFTTAERLEKMSKSQTVQAKKIGARLKKASKKELTRSSSPEEREAAQQAVKAALETLDEARKDTEAFVRARRGRDAFLAYVNEHGGTQRREALDEDVRGLFDELLVIVADGVYDLAETDSGLVPQALTDLLNDTQILLRTLKTIETTAEKTLEAVNVGNAAADERYIETTGKLDNISGLINEHLAGRNADCERKVRFGSLPAQAVGFVDRREQADLYEALARPEPADSMGKRETSQLALDDPQVRGSNADNNADHSTDGVGGGSSADGDGVSSSSDGAGRAANGSGSSTNGSGSSTNAVGSSAVGGPVVVCGMRGVGKSQLAAAYYRECEKSGWSLVAWMDASSREALVAGLAGLAVDMGIDDGKGDPDAAACRCVNRLNSGEGDRLLVFDNVDDFDDLAGLVPRSDGLRVLVTTTVASPGDSAGHLIAVGAFTRPQSVDFIRERTGLDDDAGAARLAGALGDLPVALAQAAGTIEVNGYTTIDEYLAELREYRLDEVVDRLPGDNYPDLVHAALRKAYESALDILADKDRSSGEEDLPRVEAASAQLAALALLAPSGVPRPWLHRIGTRMPIARQSLGALIAHSICTPSQDGRYVRIHGLQGRVLREDYNKQPEVFASLEKAVVTLLEGIDMDESSKNDAQRADALDMADHLRAIAEQQQGQAHHSPHEARINLPSVGKIMKDTIYRLTDMGRPQTSLNLAEAVKILTNDLSLDHPFSIVIKNNLARAYVDTENFKKATELYINILDNMPQSLIDIHYNLLVRNDIGRLYLHTGASSEAVKLYKTLLKDVEQLFPYNDPKIFAVRNNLANAYQAIGEFQKSLETLSISSDDMQKSFDISNRDVLIAINNIATTHHAAGNFREAIDIYKYLKNKQESLLGYRHPDTLITSNNLAYAYISAERYKEAIKIYSKIFKVAENVFGTLHYSTLRIQFNFATAYDRAGNYSEAIEIYEKLLKTMKKVFEVDHPLTLATRNNLAAARKKAQQASSPHADGEAESAPPPES